MVTFLFTAVLWTSPPVIGAPFSPVVVALPPLTVVALPPLTVAVLPPLPVVALSPLTVVALPTLPMLSFILRSESIQPISLLLFVALFLDHDLLRFIPQFLPPMLIPQLSHRIGKVDFNAPFVDKDPIHFRIRQNALVFFFEFHERVLERVTGLPVSDDLAGLDFAKPGKYDLQVVLLCHRVQLTHK